MSFDTQILQFMAAPGYRPMKQHELARALQAVSKGQRADFRHDLYRLADEGKIIKLRKNRWGLPDTRNEIIGTIKMMPKGGAIFIPDDENESEIYISDRNQGVALPDDKVAIEVFHSEYAARQRERRGQTDLRAEGRVTSVIKRHSTTTVGLLKHTPYYSYVIPDAQGFRHDVRIEDTQHIPENHKVLVKLHNWSDPYHPLNGEIIEDLGNMGDPGVDIDSLLREAGIREDFPQEVIDEANRLSGEITPEKMERRTDLRHAVTFTIDPETAKDYDDAISLEPHPDGGWILGVHIADVSTYVTPGSKIDAEAYHRGNSIYLVDRAVMMLPKELTTKICSLNPENDHLSHTAEIHLSDDAEMLDYKTYPSVIHSKCRMTYTQVQKFIDGKTDHGIPEQIIQRLENLWPLVQKVRARRIASGSIEINTPEIEIKLNAQGKVEKMMPRSESRQAYGLVEDCMLLANRAVAETLINAELPAIYRVHEEPDEEQWAAMGMELQALGIPMLPQTRTEINEAVKMAIGTPVEYTANLAILRNFKRAEYSNTQIGHFGLAFEDYTHFTSPIRRYADLLVHRLLNAVEQGKQYPISGEQIAEIAQHCTETEKKADELEKKSTEKKRIEYYNELMNSSQAQTFKGYIVAIKGKGMIVELPDSLQRGMITFASVTSDWLEANDEMTQAQTKNGKVVFTIGQEVEVMLAKVDTARGFIDFVLADQTAGPRRRERRPKIEPDLRTGQPRQKNKRRRRR
ncbi:ribonuclease R family protein [Pontiella agarivorans]|uniref:Ribonuclease R n=1 Tax=Pontiella agarivorans TaxID=3038953 RepID=A0ABU5N1P4_9BACT|nr:VacB/RNase II family 3'-5' exoribonuclease [Pontiella agarivorans]MDZ8120370.1 VacB/RNase II family 3'-5' exoribonuclease [Pontiella agarivorans]